MTKQLPWLYQNNGRSIPQIGLGVDGTGNEVAAAAIESALELGYRSIDTAAFYANEPGVGDGIDAQVCLATNSTGSVLGSLEKKVKALGPRPSGWGVVQSEWESKGYLEQWVYLVFLTE